MKKFQAHSISGYTFVELLVSIALLSVILLGVYGVMETGNAVLVNDGGQVDMQQQARNALDRIVREVRASSIHTITVNNADSDTVTFTTPTSPNVKYYRSGTDLVREYPAGTISKLASNIAHLKFTNSPGALTVKLRAEKTMYSRTVSFPLTQKILLRNE